MFLALLALPTGSAFAQAAQSASQIQLTLPQVVEKLVERNGERAKALESYKAKRVYNLDYVGFPSGLHADMAVDMAYYAPATKEFHVTSENGPRWLVNRVLRKLLETEQEAIQEQNRQGIELNPNNYDFKAIAYEQNDSGCTYVLTVEPKIATKFVYRGRVWVDNKDFAVCRIEAEPAKNPSIWIKKTEIRHLYKKVGDFWLPAENQSISTIRFDGRATLTIKYADYEIHAQHIPADSTAYAGH
jgi:hypothetical protein